MIAIKKRNGFTMILVLMVFAVLMILSTFTLSFMLTENKQAINHQYRTQAYYIARSGAEVVEAAILGMDDEEKNKIIDELQKGVVEITNEDFKVIMNRDGDKLIISSIGKKKNVEKTVRLIMGLETINGNIEVEYAVFSLGNINLSNGAIEGDVGTNNSIHISGGNPKINGDVHILDNQDFIAPKWWMDSWNQTKYEKVDLGEEKIYELIEFPTFPLNNSNTNFSLSGDNTATINKSTNYNKFTLTSNTKLYIDTTEGDIVLNIKKFNLENGHIILEGNNKLIIYANEITMGSGSTINYFKEKNSNLIKDGDVKQLDIYYNGSNGITISGNQKIRGNLSIKDAPLTVTASGSIIGNIFSNGGDIELAGNGDITKGLLYAPNSNIEFSGSGSVRGAVIGKLINITGNGKVVYDSSSIDMDNLPSVESKEIIKFQRLYFENID